MLGRKAARQNEQNRTASTTARRFCGGVAPSATRRLRWACLKRIFRRDNERGLSFRCPLAVSLQRGAWGIRAPAPGLADASKLVRPIESPKADFLNRRKHPDSESGLFKITSRCGVTVWRTRPRRSGNTCARANCGRKISRPSSIAASSSGWNVCRN